MVGGEISSLARPGSGHIYFTLKDASAQVRCAMFKGSQRGLRFTPEDGAQVILQGTVSIYEARGSYQIIVEQMEEAGEGLLRRRFEELKARLDAEGLFAAAHKQVIPKLPIRIGVVTSPTGAVIRDILNILKRRYPAAEVIVYPTRVQGEDATQEIATAIDRAAKRAECDVLIVGRGGGSLEDLWCFNEELVARAIYNCAVPVISAVGHEVDFTIADLVADIRAPTPSSAAELVVPEKSVLIQHLLGAERRAQLSMQRRLQEKRNEFITFDKRLQRMHPGAVLQQFQQRTDEFTRALARQINRLLTECNRARDNLCLRLARATPAGKIATLNEHQAFSENRLIRAMRRIQEISQHRLAKTAGALNAVSPLATLERGYAIVHNAQTGKVVLDANNLSIGDEIEAQLSRGKLAAQVTRVHKK
jgi:exodeoxyribonuclease VII large subunit